MQYYYGVRHNGKETYFSLSSLHTVVCHDGFMKEVDSTKLKKLNYDVKKYLLVTHALKSLPDVSNIGEFLLAKELFISNATFTRADLNSDANIRSINEFLKKAVQDLNLKNKELEFDNSELRWQLELCKHKKTPKGIVVVKNIPLEPIFEHSKTPAIDQDEDFSKLKTKMSLVESDLKLQNSKNKQLETERNDALTRLEKLQKWIKSKAINSKSESIISNEVSDQANEKNLYSGLSLDGSAGFHERRESGRFGSLSSFDNYGDEYNEKDDPELNGF